MSTDESKPKKPQLFPDEIKAHRAEREDIHPHAGELRGPKWEQFVDPDVDGRIPAKQGRAPKKLPHAFAQKIRRELRRLDRERASHLQALKAMNAIECTEPGCPEPRDERSKRCSKHRLEHKREVQRVRQARCRAKRNEVQPV